MTLIKFAPTKEFDCLANQLEQHFSNRPSAFSQNDLLPKVDIFEAEDALIVDLEAPGFARSDLKIILEDNILTISGEKKSGSEINIIKNFRRERSSGNFKRKFTLPVNVNPDEVAAKFENGVLRITLQKLDVKNVNEKNIELK